MEQVIQVGKSKSNKDLILEIKGLSVEYRTDEGIVKAVNSLDLSLERGKTIGLVGETGAGKTSTGLSIQKLIPNPPGIITEGKIILDGDDIIQQDEEAMEKIRGNKVSMIFQDPMTSLNPVLSIESQIAEGIAFHKKLSKTDSIVEARKMLEMVGIPAERGKEYPHQFSGGMRQRVVIAIALACEPELLIADEPTTALDVTIQAQVLDLIKNLQIQHKMSMLLITHDLGVVAETCDDVAIMYAGHIIEKGSLEQVFKNFKHPYTKGLFHSIPRIGEKERKLIPIKGLMPDPSNLPIGCPFAPRCDYVLETCHTVKPVVMSTIAGHEVSCHLYNKCNVNERNLLNE